MPKWELFKRNLIFVFLSLAQFFFCIIPFKWLATQFNRTTAAKFSAGMCMVVCYDDASFVCFVDNISLHTYHWLRFDSSTSAQFSFCSWPVTHTHHQKKTANWSLPLVVDPFNAKLIAHSEVFKLWYHKTGSDLLGIVSECPVFMPFKLIECVKHVSSSSASVCVCVQKDRFQWFTITSQHLLHLLASDDNENRTFENTLCNLFLTLHNGCHWTGYLGMCVHNSRWSAILRICQCQYELNEWAQYSIKHSLNVEIELRLREREQWILHGHLNRPVPILACAQDHHVIPLLCARSTHDVR